MVKSNFKQDKFRPAFTMIELIFVIVVLGILAAVAIPRLAASRDDAVLVKGKSQVAAIRGGIALQKSKNMLQGTPQTNGFFPDKLDAETNYNADNQRLFNYNDGNSSNILEYPIFSQKDKDGGWLKTAANTYSFQVMNIVHTFSYTATTGIFNCTAGTYCSDLTR